MSGPGVGFEYPPTEVSWLKRDVLLFANTVGATTDDLHFLYVRIAHTRSLICGRANNQPLGKPSRFRRLPNLPHPPA